MTCVNTYGAFTLEIWDFRQCKNTNSKTWTNDHMNANKHNRVTTAHNSFDIHSTKCLYIDFLKRDFGVYNY